MGKCHQTRPHDPNLSLIKKGIHPLKSNVFITHDLFRAANKEGSSRCQALVKFPEQLFFRLLGKINQHVSANHQMTVRWISILE